MDKTKEYKRILQQKENQIIRETLLWCANNNVSFEKSHNILMRNAMRQFFKEGVYPIVREIYDNPSKTYSDG